MFGTTEALRSHIANASPSVLTLKTLITLWVIGVLILTWFIVDNPWLLAGILAYEVLP